MKPSIFEHLERVKSLMGLIIEQKNDVDTVIFISGLLDRGEGFDQQVNRVKQSSGSKKVIAFKYNDSDTTIKRAIDENPNCAVVMFSAGANKSLIVTNTLKDKSKAFVIEPVCGNRSTKQAVSNGMPAKNVFVGNSCANGKGIVPGTSSSDASGHFAALNSVIGKIFGGGTTYITPIDKKISDSEVDSYFASSNVDEKKEKKIESQYGKSKCVANNNYKQGPELDEITKEKVLRIGHMGKGVEQIQLILKKLNYDLGACGVDGLFGKKTKRALEKFQEDNGITVSSSIDLETLKKLEKGGVKNTSLNTQKTTSTQPSDAVNDEKAKVTSKDQYDIYKYTGYVIFIPKNYKSKNVHVLFCGKSTSATSNIGDLYINAVNPILNKVAVVITHSYHGAFSEQLNIVQNFINKKGFNLKVNSVAGFSRGGNVAWLYAGGRSNFKFVGLIDPSTPENNIDLGNNSILECNPSNWGSAGKHYTNLKWYCEHKDDAKYSGKVFCVKQNHASIMKTFYQRYGSRV
jgi:peptidoglycan hydrolase-like protein with peptidoglycan-binding domain